MASFLRRHSTPDTYREAEDRRAATIERRQAPVEPPTVKSLHVGRYGGEVRPEAPKPLPKLTRRQKVRQDIRDSAKGEDCTVRIACWGDVIWSHGRWPSADKGGATKALDLCGAYACVGCDQVFDGQRQRPAGMTQEQVDLAWMHGHLRSLVRLAEKGLL